jgi:hypothetical protein
MKVRYKQVDYDSANCGINFQGQLGDVPYFNPADCKEEEIRTDKGINLGEKAWIRVKEEGPPVLIKDQETYNLFLFNKYNKIEKEFSSLSPEWNKAERMVEEMMYRSAPIPRGLELRLKAESITKELEENKSTTEEERASRAEKAERGKEEAKKAGWPTLPLGDDNALMKRAM